MHDGDNLTDDNCHDCLTACVADSGQIMEVHHTKHHQVSADTRRD